MIATVLALLALHTAAGMLVGLTIVPIKDAGRRFFVVNGVFVLGFLGAAIGLGLAGASAGPLGPGLAGAAALAVVVHMASLRGDRFAAARAFVIAGAGLAMAAVVVGGVEAARLAGENAAAAPAANGASGRVAPSIALAVSSGVGQALLGGVTLLAMILGHFYLILPRLAITPLKRLTALFLAALAFRVVVCGAGLWLAGAGIDGGTKSLVIRESVVILPRILFGLVGPLVVGYMIWETVRIRSTQSATGILYAATAMVLIGEASAAWMAVSLGVYS